MLRSLAVTYVLDLVAIMIVSLAGGVPPGAQAGRAHGAGQPDEGVDLSQRGFVIMWKLATVSARWLRWLPAITARWAVGRAGFDSD